MDTTSALINMAQLLTIWTERFQRHSNYTADVLQVLETAGGIIEDAWVKGNIPDSDYKRLQREANQLVSKTEELTRAGQKDSLAILKLMDEADIPEPVANRNNPFN